MSYIGNPITQSAFLTDQFSGTGSQTAFTMSVAPANTAAVVVAIHGVVQDPSTYSVTGTTLTFSAAPPAGTGNISARYLGIPASGVTTTAYRTVSEFTATSSQSVFTPPAYTVGFLEVYRNGIRLGAADFTASNGVSVVLATPANNNDLVTIVSFYVSSVLNAIPATANAVNSLYLSPSLNLVTPNIGAATGTSLTAPIHNSATTLSLQTGGTTGLYMDASQNIGLGVGNPGVKLDISGNIATEGGNTGITLGLNQGGGATLLYNANGNLDIAPRSGYNTVFRLVGGGTEAGRIDSSGRLLINSTSLPTNIASSTLSLYTANPLFSTCIFAGNGNAASATGYFMADTWFVQNESASLVRSYATGTAGNSAYGQWLHYSSKSGGSPSLVFTASNGSFAVAGALSKGSGSFRIDHPLPALTETHNLVHSFIEGPQADLIYRGRVTLVAGTATVNIDQAAGMTEGTFVLLCRDVQCFTTNESDWSAVRGSVSGNILTIESQDNTATSSISWMVIGERQDRHMYETDWTDENGKVIVEPVKQIIPPSQMVSGS